MRAVQPKPALKDVVGLWVRFQNKRERYAAAVAAGEEMDSPPPSSRSVVAVTTTDTNSH